MEQILSYNFHSDIAHNTSWSNLFNKERRDANFAAVAKDKDGTYIALRDHLGTVPLYYRVKNEKVHWSVNYNDLVEPSDKIEPNKIREYLGIASAKVIDLIPDIKIVPPGSVIKITNGTTDVQYTYRMHVAEIKLSNQELIESLRNLVEKATERAIKEDTVGLYMSGGMDSGLVGHILKKKGVSIHAYTALPWGVSGTELSYAKKNAEIIGCDSHSYIDVNPDKYQSYFSSLKDLYRTPHGTATSINISALWLDTEIKNERQVIFAQNTDTLASSVPAQVNALIMSVFPSYIRRKVANMPHPSLLKNYLHHCTRGALSEHAYEDFVLDTIDPIAQIAQAGMYIGHTQSDSEAINAPSIASGQLASNPFYDMDLIEFYLGIHWKHKIAINTQQKTFLSFEKKLFRQLACEVLPKDLVYRKKGFVLPKQRNKAADVFFKGLAKQFNGVCPSSHYETISLSILMKNFGFKN